MIRTLNDKDLDDFLKIRMDSLRLQPEAFGASFSEKPDRRQTKADLKAKNAENFILGYFEAAQLIGMLGMIRFPRQKMRHKATIWGMFVYPEYRGKGIGRQLMEEAIKRAEQLEGLEKINLSVINVQQNALKLYQKLGFEAYGEEKNSLKVIGRHYHEIFMSRSCESK